MKNKFKYIFSLFMVLFMGACNEEFLEMTPQDKLTGDNFFKNEEEVRSATLSLYAMPWFDFNDKLLWMAGDIMSGDLHHTWDQEGQFFYFSFNEGNAHISSGWRGLFRVVAYANSIINDMPAAAEGKVSQEVIDKAVAEARFIRGTAYYLITELFGDVPIVENSTELVVNNNMMLPKNTRSSVYEFIIRDLQFAADLLPASDAPGRVTKWSAKGMLSKVYLTRAQNLSWSTSAQDFEMAKQHAAEVIENSGLSLMPNYADLFKIENNNNSESLFAFQWMGGAYGRGNSRQANYARNSFITGNGEAWGGGKSASYDFMQDMELYGGNRSEATVMTLGNYYPEINKEEGGYTYNIVTTDADGKDIEGAAPVLNNIKKYVVGSAADNPSGTVTTGQATALNTYVLRLADVYLIYVEAAMGAAGVTSDPKAIAYFNAVRKRAGIDIDANPVSEIGYERLLAERRVEFGFEGITWFDIKRYFYRNEAAAIAYLQGQQRGLVAQRITGEDAPDKNSYEGYTWVQNTANVNVVVEKVRALPIPAAEVGNNPLLAPSAEPVEYVFE